MHRTGSRRRSRARAGGELCALAAFVAVLGVPLGLRSLDPDADRSTEAERRRPGPTPRWPRSLEELLLKPRAIDAWLTDRFAFRADLIHWHNRIKFSLFGVSPATELERGPNDWIFTTEDRALVAHRGLAPLSEGDLWAWSDALEERRVWLAERGARFALVVAPGKPAIYPDQLPPAIRRGAATPLDQFVEHMAAHSSVELIDVRPSLLAARAAGDPGSAGDPDWLYYPYGTHWTDRGNFVAYREIAARLAPSFPSFAPWSQADFAPTPSEDPGDHWGGRLRMRDQLPQGSIRWLPQRPQRARSSPDPDQPGQPLFELPEEPGQSGQSGQPGRVRVLLVHDSFGHGLRPLLAEHCARLRSSDDLDLDLELIEVERPDLVLQVMVERKLLSLRLSPLSADAAHQEAAARFAAAGALLFELRRPGDRASLASYSPAAMTPELAAEGDGLRLRCRGAGQGVALPELPDSPNGTGGPGAPGSRFEDFLIRLVIESPKETELLALFKTAGDEDYSLRRTVRSELQVGRNEVYLRLDARSAVGRIALVPVARGNYLVETLEVRAE